VFDAPFEAETVTVPPQAVKLNSPLLFAVPPAEVDPVTETDAPEAYWPDTVTVLLTELPEQLQVYPEIDNEGG